MSTSPESPVWADRFDGASNVPAGANGDTTRGDSAAELRHDIDRTRGAMSGTINAIQSRMTPQHLLIQGKDALASSATAVAAQAQARTSELVSAAQGQTQRLRFEYERLRAQYPWLPVALIGGAAAIATLVPLAIWLGVRANDR